MKTSLAACVYGLFLLSLSLVPAPARAEDAKKGNVLDFDADVIQGERRKPEIFIQVGKDRSNLDSVIYGRQDFNDFHRVDRIWRPAFYELPPPPAARPAQPKEGKK